MGCRVYFRHLYLAFTIQALFSGYSVFISFSSRVSFLPFYIGNSNLSKVTKVLRGRTEIYKQCLALALGCTVCVPGHEEQRQQLTVTDLNDRHTVIFHRKLRILVLMTRTHTGCSTLLSTLCSVFWTLGLQA